ncbi:MAG: hypothetical protein KJ847_04250 [Firmicutes bacterium]|nr:hypothetical protein [Bacillota bacterium]
MKKLILFLVLMLVLMFRVDAQACSGSNNYPNVLEGEDKILTAPTGTSAPITWQIISPSNYPSQDSNSFQGAFSQQSGCTVHFKVFKNGVYNLKADNADVTVTVEDLRTAKNFGHECMVVDTGNCGAIVAYGDISATNYISGLSMFASGRIHSYNNITVGTYGNPNVILTPTLATLPALRVTGSMTATGALSVTGNAIVTGTATASKFIGPIDFSTCSSPPKIYASGSDVVIELGSC